MSAPSDRTPSQAFALTLGRLRALIRQHTTPTAEALAETLAEAQEVGRRAHAANLSLALLEDLVAGLVAEQAGDVRSSRGALIDAAATGYRDAEPPASGSDPASPAPVPPAPPATG